MFFEEICEIIENETGADGNSLSLETNLLKDLEADSLMAVEIILAIEDKFDIEIPDSVAESFQTIGDIVEYVEGNVE